MKRRVASIRIEHRPLPRDYAPRYPATLAPAEFRALVLVRNDERVRALLAAGLACLVVERADAQDAAPKRVPAATLFAREQRVLRALQAVAESHDFQGFDQLRHGARKEETTYGSVQHQVYVPVMFGTAPSYVFDRGAAALLAADLFRAYGFEPELGVRLDEEPVHALLDGADRKHKVAFELLGRARSEFVHPSAEPEPPFEDLSAEEHAALAKQGWKIQVNEAAAFDSEHLADLAPYLAYALGVLDFLNSIDDGPDLDLLGLHFQRQLALECPAAKDVAWKGGTPELEPVELLRSTRVCLKQSASFTVSFPAEAKRERRAATKPYRTEPFPESAPVTGSITCLQLPITRAFDSAEPAAPRQRIKARLVQERAAPATPFVVEANATTLFLGSDFDPLRAFTLEVELGPGFYLYSRDLFVCVPKR